MTAVSRLRPGLGRAIGIFITLAVAIADQLTKSWAVRRLSQGPIHLVGPLQFKLEYNSGFAFSLGTSLGPEISVIAGGAVVLLTYFAIRASSIWLRVSLGLIAGGALGNLADRILRHNDGAVIDFIYSGFWPTFNLADSAIVIGAIGLGVYSLRRRHV